MKASTDQDDDGEEKGVEAWVRVEVYFGSEGGKSCDHNGSFFFLQGSVLLLQFDKNWFSPLFS